MKKTKSIFNEEVIDGIQSIFNNSNVDIKHYKKIKTESIAIDCVTVKAGDPKGSSAVLDEGCNNEYMKGWREDVGILLVKDFNKGDFSRYYEAKFNDCRVLLREWFDDEAKYIKEHKFDHIDYGSVLTELHHYTLIKLVGKGDPYSTKMPVTNMNLVVNEESELIITDADCRPDPEEKEEVVPTDTALF